MNYSKLQELKDTTYYSIIVFKHKDNMGTRIKNEYKREANAIKKFNELARSGLYEYITMRKEEVFLRKIGKVEISCSSLVKKWGVA